MKDLIYSYKGDILTEETVEPMLLDILGKAEGRGYSRLLCHYLRSVMMEVLSNIAAHGYFDKSLQNSISIEISETTNDTILVQTRNCMSNDEVASLTLQLNKINLMSAEELKEQKIKTLQKNINNPGSPQIGLILIRMASGKPIVCKFEPCNEDYSFISFEIELNKDQKFKKERTKRTPQINFDIDNQLFEIVGVSFPEDANEYYAQIESWVEDHEDVISQLQNPVLKIDLEYLNSISLKNIARTIRRLLDTNEEKFTVNWYYDTDDEILREEGSEISEILHKKFNFIPKN